MITSGNNETNTHTDIQIPIAIKTIYVLSNWQLNDIQNMRTSVCYLFMCSRKTNLLVEFAQMRAQPLIESLK